MPLWREIAKEISAGRLPVRWTTSDLCNNIALSRDYARASLRTEPPNESASLPDRDLGTGTWAKLDNPKYLRVGRRGRALLYSVNPRFAHPGRMSRTMAPTRQALTSRKKLHMVKEPATLRPVLLKAIDAKAEPRFSDRKTNAKKLRILPGPVSTAKANTQAPPTRSIGTKARRPTITLSDQRLPLPPGEEAFVKQYASALLKPLRDVKKASKYNFPVGKTAKDKLSALGITIDAEDPDEWNLALRRELSGKLIEFDKGHKKWQIKNEELCLWVVRYWGGTERSMELSSHLKAIILDRTTSWQPSESVELGFDRISSWSKVLALAFPDTCAIYDSRTAFALNWLQFEINLKRSSEDAFLPYWPVPSGTNTLLGMLNPELLFVSQHVANLHDLITHEEQNVFGQVEGAKKSRLANRLRAKLQIDKPHAYYSYCSILSELGKNLFPEETPNSNSLLRTEMLLFSAATQIVPSKIAGYVESLSPSA